MNFNDNIKELAFQGKIVKSIKMGDAILYEKKEELSENQLKINFIFEFNEKFEGFNYALVQSNSSGETFYDNTFPVNNFSFIFEKEKDYYIQIQRKDFVERFNKLMNTSGSLLGMKIYLDTFNQTYNPEIIVNSYTNPLIKRNYSSSDDSLHIQFPINYNYKEINLYFRDYNDNETWSYNSEGIDFRYEVIQ